MAAPDVSTVVPVSPSQPAPSGGLAPSAIWLYGALGFPLALLGYPLGIFLPRAYASDLGIAPAAIGLIIFSAAIFDAVTDPAMGWGSDRFRSRWGRRKIWILSGAPVLALSAYLLFDPPASTTVLTFAFWYIFLRVGTTLVSVPYGAWGAELSGEYHMRTRIQHAREVFVLIGLIAAAALPFILEETRGGRVPESEVLYAFSWLVVISLPLITLVVLASVPEVPATAREGQTPFVRSLGLMFKNRLFLLVILIELLITGGEAFRNTLSLFFMRDVIGVERVGRLYLLYFGMGLIAIPYWTYLARRYGKHRSLAGAMILVMAVSVAIFFLERGQLAAFYVLFALKGFCFGAFAYLPRAILADVIDLDTARSGDARTGSYFAVMGFMSKCAGSFGGLSLPILSWVGYKAVSGAVNGPDELRWLGALYALVPTAVFVVALYLCWTWPLTSERHARLRAKLERRNARLSAQREA